MGDSRACEPRASKLAKGVNHVTHGLEILHNGSDGREDDLTGNCTFLAETAREEAARDAVEVVEVAEASLDHGEQMLAIARKKTLRLASIEGCKLLRQQPP